MTPANPERAGNAPDLARSRALVARPANERWSDRRYEPHLEERARLANTLGGLLRELRAEYGLSTRSLALRAAVARSSVRYLESGERRPRPSLLEAVAFGLDPDRQDELTRRLVEAAGPSLRPDTPATLKRRRRRARAARRAANRRIYVFYLRTEAVKRASWGAFYASMEALDPPGALDDIAALTRCANLHDESRVLQDLADRMAGALSYQHNHGHPHDTRTLDAYL